MACSSSDVFQCQQTVDGVLDFKDAVAWRELVLERFDQITLQHHRKTAVQSGARALTYQELSDRSIELATHLRGIGVKNGSLVGIGMDRSIEMVAAVLGVWRSGATTVLLDPDFPTSRLSQMIEDAKPGIIITNRAHSSRLSFPGVECVIFDAHFHSDASQQKPQMPVSSEDIAYIIYTSGSTGKPKGVQVSHGALANFLAGIQQSLQMTDSDTLIAVTTLSFDISILEIILPLMVGATVVVVDKGVSGDGHQLAKVLESAGASFLQATPGTWRLLLDAGWKGKKDLTVICGGETFPRPLADALLERSRRVFNVYGPTEATIWATLEEVSSEENVVPIGRALPNYTTCILDDNLNDVPAGEIGQLYIGGKSLATGYLNQPEETGRRFIMHSTRSRLYATGDIARMRTDGKLEFTGRADTQVKVRGFRVELGDIESQIVSLPTIKDAIVIAKEDTHGEKKLIAYIVANGEVNSALVDLRNTLKSLLPHYMIPHHYVALTEFPRTLNNKVDRRQLTALEIERDRVIPAAPTNGPVEAFLQGVWVEILGEKEIFADDNFFDLGGDSIRAAMITNRIQEWLGETVWPVVIFDAPTIRELAAYLRKTYKTAVDRKAPSDGLRTDEEGNRVVDQALMTEFNALIRPIAPYHRPSRKNPRAIFILNPPRSGSTLLRVMMAGHPGIFAPPEIELLTFNTMGERTKEFSGRESYRLEGTIRAVMEIKNCSVDEARALLAKYEQKNVSVAEFYGVMQEWLGDRIIVDKTPANCLDIEALRRVEIYFENPIYVHLSRHPLGMIRSFLEARLSEVFFRRVPHNFSPRELAELIWVRCHTNILTVLESIPRERQFHLTFEALTERPWECMEKLCDLTKLKFCPEMIEPQKNKEKKMTNGLHAVSKMMGDPKFHKHKSIDPTVTSRWKDDMKESSLGTPAIAIAGKLGYNIAVLNTEKREEFIL